MPAPSFLGALLEHPDRPFVLRNPRSRCLVASHVEAALDASSRRTGLLGRTGLDAGSALILAPCRGIHTCFMRFRIDVAFVDRTGTVLRVEHDLEPWRARISLLAFAVIELPAGTIKLTDVRPGDILRLDAA